MSSNYLTRTFGLVGKKAVVTGSTQGLGRAMAEALLKAGASVVINGRYPDKTARISKEIEEACKGEMVGRVFPVAADLSKHDQVAKFVDDCIQVLGGVDALVNNAGVNLKTDTPFVDQSYEDVQWIMNTNFLGVADVTRAFIPALKQSGNGRIVNTSSIGGLVGLAGNSTYSASKGALQLFTQSLALELGPIGINVNCVCPGIFDTDMNTKLKPKEQEISSAIPLRRFGRAEELGGVVVFLCSDASSYVSGSSFVVYGGFTAGK